MSFGEPPKVMYFLLFPYSISLLVADEVIQIVNSFVSKYKICLRLGIHRLGTSTNYPVYKDTGSSY